MKALILVDLQNDFMPGGALAVPEGDRVVPFANRLMERFPLIVATQDWHPADHLSFASQHPGRRPGERIVLDGVEQVLWPDHCVEGTYGAEFHPALDAPRIHHVVRKGVDRRVDSYSAFFDNARGRSTGLADYLRAKGVDELWILGLATDYCVKASALDAVELGFRTFVLRDGCRGIDASPGDVERAWAEMRTAGVTLVDGTEPIEILAEGSFLRLARRGRWEYCERVRGRDVVGVVAVTGSGEAVFVEQFRHPLGAATIEWVAGLSGDVAGAEGEPLEAAAQRELEEEAGFRADRFEFLVRLPSSAGMTNETVALLRAHGLHRVGDGGGHGHEDIRVHLVPLAGVHEWLRERQAEGKLVDPKIFAGLYFLSRDG